MAQFPTNEAVVYLAQGVGNPQKTQLMRGVQSDGEISFFNVGAPHNSSQYNAIGFNEQDGYLYGVRASVGGGASPKIVKIGPAGGVTVVKDATAGSVTGSFGAVANRFYYFTNTHMYYTNVAVPTGVTQAVALSGATVAGVPADVTFADGYFWGYPGSGQIVRIGQGGFVTRFNVPALNGMTAAGGAFTYGNGNLGFSMNAGGIFQLKVTNPGSATPTFTLVSRIDGPGSSSNDATSSKGLPADLSLSKTASVSEATRGQSFTYALSVRNEGAGVSSGFTVSDSVPASLTIGTLPTGCSAEGQQLTCSGGRLGVNNTATFTIPVTVTSSAARGTVSNTASVLGNEADPVASNNSDSADVRILVPSLSVTKTAAVVGGGAAVEGAQIVYTFVVTNTGDLPLTGVTITDPNVTSVTPASASVAVGASATFTSAPVTVDASDVAAGSVDNTATATGTGGGQTVSGTSSVSTPVPSNPALTAVKTAELVDDVVNGTADAGETIEYAILVTNTGDVTLTGVTVDDPLLGTMTPVTLAPGASHSFTGSYVVTADDLAEGAVVNTATARGTPPRGSEIVTPPTSTTTPTTDVGMTLVKSATWPGMDDNQPAQPGDSVTYSFIVTNTGNVAIQGVSIDDPMFGPGEEITPESADIQPGEQAIFTGTIVIAAEDLVDGDVPNVATASGTPAGGGGAITTPPASFTIPLAAPVPALDVVKTATLGDTNGSTTADVGEVITYRIVVTNTGNVPLSDVVLFDPMFTADPLDPVSTFSSLRPGEQGVYTTTYTVTQDDVDSTNSLVSNTATASAPDPTGGADLSGSATAQVPTAPYAPATVLTKTAELDDANSNGVADADEQITYTFLVRNTGNVTLGTVTIDDPMFPSASITIAGPLAPGASASTNVVYTVLEADLASGAITNTAVAKTTDPRGDEVDSPPSSTSTETSTPGLQIVKSAELIDTDQSGAASIGETIVYSFTVTNTGNTRLEGVQVVDARIPGIQPSSVTLEASAEYVFTANYIVTEADILAGEIENVAHATGTVPGAGEPIRSSDSDVTTGTDPAAPGLAITKSAVLGDANGNTLADIGELVTYTFLVENTGNVTITGIAIDDPAVSGLPAPFDLAPRESREVTASAVTVTQAHIDAGEIVNVATATGTGPAGPVTSEESRVTVETTPAAPAMTLTKSVAISGPLNDNGVADATEELTYTFVVTNTGNVTLDDVVIDDPTVSGITSADSGPLAPGETRTFTAVYVVQASDVENPNGDGAIVNVATAVADDPQDEEVRSSQAAASIPVAAPGLSIVKSAAFDDANENGMADVGEIVTFSFEVTNTGNVQLTDVVVEDARIGASVNVGTLAAGQTRTVTTTYAVSEADIVAQELVNSAKASGVIPGVPPTPIESPESVTSVPLGPDHAELELEKTAVHHDTDGDGLVGVGERIVYRFTITNTGNRTITDISVNDPMIEELLPAAVASLAPGESVTVDADEHIVAEGDLVDGEVRNVATVSGTGPDGEVTSTPATATLSAHEPEPSPANGGLPNTGAEVRLAIAIALLALGGGGIALAVSRSRFRTAPAHRA